MLALITTFFASNSNLVVPDSGASAVLFASGVLAAGLFARFLKNRKK